MTESEIVLALEQQFFHNCHINCISILQNQVHRKKSEIFLLLIIIHIISLVLKYKALHFGYKAIGSKFEY